MPGSSAAARRAKTEGRNDAETTQRKPNVFMRARAHEIRKFFMCVWVYQWVSYGNDATTQRRTTQRLFRLYDAQKCRDTASLRRCVASVTKQPATTKRRRT